MTVDDIKIEPQFRDMFHALSEEQLDIIRDAMIRDGKVDGVLTVWKGHNILLDGHNRLRIYQDVSLIHMIDPPVIVQREFASEQEAWDWAFNYQKGRRNTTDAELKIALGRRYNDAKTQDGNRTKPTGVKSATASAVSSERRVAQQVAKSEGVSERTVLRAGAFERAVQKIAQVVPKAVDDIKAERLDLTQQDVVDIADSGNIKKAFDNLKKHGSWKGKPKASDTSSGEGEVRRRIQLASKSYEVLGGHVEWLKAHATSVDTKNTLQEMSESLKTVFDGIEDLKENFQ